MIGLASHIATSDTLQIDTTSRIIGLGGHKHPPPLRLPHPRIIVFGGDDGAQLLVNRTIGRKSQYSTVVLTVVRVMIAKYRKSGIWGYRSSLTPEPVELK